MSDENRHLISHLGLNVFKTFPFLEERQNRRFKVNSQNDITARRNLSRLGKFLNLDSSSSRLFCSFVCFVSESVETLNADMFWDSPQVGVLTGSTS
jgi:ABC-type branched-subunit amino acid transport system ATPase component